MEHRKRTPRNSSAGLKSEQRKSTLLRRYIVLTVAIAVVVIAGYTAFTTYQRQGQIEQQLVAEARVLNSSVMSTWQFIENEQTNINTDRDGVYNFKGIYCSLVGKSVAKIFTDKTSEEYRMRYVRFNPRNIKDSPDEFESIALNQFYGNGPDEMYGFETNDQGENEFRYVAAIRVTSSCLDCHGSPVGELDVTGHPKEGLSEGDIGGAVSITMPANLYDNNLQQTLLSALLLMVGFLTVVFAATFFFFRSQVVTPLANLGRAAREIGQGNLKAEVSNAGPKEVSDLAECITAMETELDTMYATLEDQVDLRTRQYLDANALLETQKMKIAEQNELLKQTNEKLLDENEYRTNIVSILSHELRTPLTAILAFVDLWESSNDAQDERARQYCEKIRNQSLTLLEMVNNVLDIAKIDAGMDQVNKEVIDLVDLIGDIAATEEPIASQSGIELTTSVAENVPLIYEDWQRLRKAVMNLLTNAVKFTEEHGHVNVAATFDEDSQTVSIAVSDTGIGIPASRIDSIFERFVQADASASRKYSGSGLGLSLVKKTMDVMGGTVAVQSVEGEGSTFTLTFPVDSIGED